MTTGPKTFPALAVLALVFTAAPTEAAEDCVLQKVLQLDLSYDQVGRPIIPVSLDGRERYFLIDTGGAYSTLDRGPAEAWGLEPEDAATWIMGVTGERSDEFVVIDEFFIENLLARERPLMLSPGAPGEDSQIHFIGTLSPDILQAYDADFDFGMGKFNLFRQDHCEGQVVYWNPARLSVIPFELNHAGHITFPVMLDGVELTAIMDTGAHYSTLNRDIAENELNIDFANETLESIGTMGEDNELVYRHTFGKLTLNGLEINAPTLNILPDLMNSNINQFLGLRSGIRLPDIIIGMTVLSQLHVYIAYGERRLYVTEAATPAAAE